MLGVRRMKDAAIGEDIFQNLKVLVTRFNLRYKNRHGFLTEGASDILGSEDGLLSKI